MFGTKKNKTAKQAHISSHPFFPAVVALWFAALLGLGSLVLPVALFEKFVTLTGISSLVSAAQPPLGTTARIAIALFAAIAGAGAGLFVARKVAASTQAQAAPTRNVLGNASDADQDEGAAVRPISAHEELGSDGLDEPIADPAANGSTYNGKRRSLAVTDDSGPSEYLDAAPLPGGPAMVDQHVDDLPDALELDIEIDSDAEADEPLELGELSDASQVQEQPQRAEADFAVPQAVAAMLAEPEPFEPRPFDAPQPPSSTNEISHMTTSPVDHLREEIGTMTDETSPPVPSAYNPFGEQDAPSAPADSPPAVPAPFSAPEVAEDSAPVAQISDHGIADKALNELGMVELVERFAFALQKKADADALAAEAEAQIKAEKAVEESADPLVFRRSAAATPASPFAPSEPSEAGAAVAEFFATPTAAPAEPEPQAAPEPAHIPVAPVEAPVAAPVAAEAPAMQSSMPSALQPLGFDEFDDEEDEGPSLSLSLRTAHQPPAMPSMPQSAPAAAPVPAQPIAQTPAAEPEAESDEEGDYSSLLAMKSPFSGGQEFVRIEDEDNEDRPVEGTVIFPGSESGSNERRAVPASDGPTRDPIDETSTEPASAPRPFDAPGAAPSNGPATAPTNANPGETERALRDALEKLQRMSGAA